jgi:circadian clock protein KaiC
MLEQLAGTGIPGLDDVLGGGLPRNRLYLFQGDPGVGKTTIGLQFLLAGAARGEQGIYITLSETAEELRTAAASHGWNLDGIGIHEVMATTNLLPDENNTLFQPSEIELGETTRAILEEVERVCPARIVIDSTSEIRLLSQSALRYRRQILALKQFFTGKACTVILLDDGSSDVDDVHLQSIAHGVVQLDQLAPLFGSERRRMRIIKLRGVKFRGGYHDMKIETGGVVMYPRLVASEHHSDFPAQELSSGIDGLDRLLGGGIDRGTTALIIGPAGVGKSAIASQYASAAASRGEKVFVFTFEESLSILRKRSRALGIPIDRELASGGIVLQSIDPAELSPGEFAQRVRRAVENDGARVVVIDSINGYYSAMPEEQFLTLQLHELFGYLRQQGVTVFLTVAQHGFVGAMSSQFDISYLTDTVVLLRFFEAGGQIRKAISVQKKRSGAHETSIRVLTFDGGGIHVGEPLEDFEGILTGVPKFLGGAAPSPRKDHAGTD